MKSIIEKSVYVRSIDIFKFEAFPIDRNRRMFAHILAY